nr:xylulose kinase-1 [Tanacetum cinerariifolium]
MIAYITKSDASEGFDQIIDFLNASSIKYALTINPNIYVSCIKQFWSSVLVKKVNDVIRLQALVDRKKVIITEATVRDALRLDDAESIDCLPNEEIFTELSRMGYEKPLTKLIFYKAFFSPKWKVGKGFSGVETPLFKRMIMAHQADEGATGVDVDDVHAAAEPSIPSPTPTTQPPLPSQNYLPLPKALEKDKVAQALEIIKLKQRVKKLERKNKLKVSGLGRLKKGEIIANMDADEDVTLKDVAAVAKEVKDDELEPAKLKEVVEVVTTAKLMTEVVTAAAATITAPITLINTATLTATPNKAYARELEAKLNKNIIWDDVIEQVQRKEKEDNAVMRFKMGYFKGMSYDDFCLIFEKYYNSNMAFLEKTKEQMEEEDSRALERTSDSLVEKAAKKQKLDEEVEELKKHLQIMPNNDDDVYTEATPLARKVPIVDYEIYTKKNKPYYKIIRADGSPQLFLSFLSLLRNFDREDLELKYGRIKECSWISKGQKLETVKVLWSAHRNIYDYTADLVGREKIYTNKICKATTARRIQTRVVFGYILHQNQDQDRDQAG